MRKSFATTQFSMGSAPVSSICFDEYGGYFLASQANSISIFAGKQWQQPQTVVDLANPISKSLFSRSDLCIYSSSVNSPSLTSTRV